VNSVYRRSDGAALLIAQTTSQDQQYDYVTVCGFILIPGSGRYVG